MYSLHRSIAFASPLSLAIALACAQNSSQPVPSPAEFRRTVAGSTWELTELAGQAAPTGAGGRRATLIFDADTARAGGFAGCNRYGGSYTVEGSTIRFGPLAMTKMACAEGMELEQRLAQALERTNRYETNGAQLTFFNGSEAVARFTRAGT